jgi:hypothetical protein
MCSLYNVIPNGYVFLDGLMSYLLLFLLLLPLTLTLPNTTIADDNFNIQLDKTAHYTTSFGLYFMFYTMYTDSLLPMDTTISIPLHSMISSTGVGLVYELYQSTPHSKSDGFSVHDMVYNIMGIMSARFIHEVFLYFKEVI